MNIQKKTQYLFEDLDLFFTRVPVLVYHHVTADGSTQDSSGCSITVSQFEQQMRFLYNRGYQSLTLMELLDPLLQGAPHQKKAFALTFDDGFSDFYTHAHPILRCYGFNATVFLVTDLLGRQSDWDGEKGACMLTWENIDKLSANGISFGSHTCTHPYLHQLSDEQVWHELSTSKKCLEEKLHSEISFIAYPFGESSPKIRRMAKDVGYKAAFGVMTGKPGRYNWWRSECGSRDTLRTFSFKLTWLYSFFQKTRGWVREETPLGRFLRKIKHKWLLSSAL